MQNVRLFYVSEFSSRIKETITQTGLNALHQQQSATVPHPRLEQRPADPVGLELPGPWNIAFI